jgi:uncharacterized membrane protein
MIRVVSIFFIALIFTTTGVQSTYAQTTNNVIVQAILFYSPNCPHCHEVIENHLPVIKDQYGNQFQLLGIDTSQQSGAKLYEETVTIMGIPQERRGVPTLVIGESYLVGGLEIPEQLPMLIEEGLAGGGIGWPAIPGLKEAVPNLPPPAGSQSASDSQTLTRDSSSELIANEVLVDGQLAQEEDWTAFAIGWIVMAAMLLATAVGTIRLARMPKDMLLNSKLGSQWRGWSIIILALIGLGVASYLAYVEVTQVEAVCGPVGECNIVQSSQFAKILGVPVAIFGIIYYLAVIGLWLLSRSIRAPWAKRLPFLIVVISLGGMLFSIYLTALELLVIKAICAWCLSSAVITTLIFFTMVAKLTKQDTGKPMRMRGVASHTG